MILTTEEAFIAKPLPQVFNHVYSLENQAEYNTSIRSAIRNAELYNGFPAFTIEIDLTLFKLKEIYRISEFSELSFFVAICDHSLLSFEDRYEFESVSGGTLLKISDRMELKGLLGLSEGIVKGNLKIQMKDNLQRLKQIIEGLSR